MRKIFIVMLIIINVVLAQKENWIFQYNGPGNSSDGAYSIVYGPDGNIYVGGSSYGTNTYNLIVVSLTPQGDTNWIYRCSIPRSNGYVGGKRGIVYGSDGNIYVGGSLTDTVNGYTPDWLIVSLTNTGTERWVYTHNGAGNSYDILYSITYGSDGNIYAAGYTTDSTTSMDFTVISLTNAGAERWIYAKNGTANSWESATSIVYGLDGNIYAAGYLNQSSTSMDWAVVSLTTTGTERWIYTDNLQYTSYCYSIAYGEDNNIYLTGYIYNSTTSSYDIGIRSLTNTGTERWVYTYDYINSYDFGSEIIYTQGGELYVAGRSDGGVTNSDAVIINLDTTGTEHWVYRYNTVQNYEEYLNSIVLGSDENLYAVGYVEDTVNYYYDVLVISVDTAGTGRWGYSYDGNLYKYDEGKDIVYGLDNNIYIAGEVFNNSNNTYDFTVISLDGKGPSAPVLISPPNNSFLDNPVTFIWHSSFDSVSGVMNYILEYDLDSLFSSPSSYIITDTFYITPVLLMNDSTYYWRVKAVDSSQNQGLWSEVWSFEVDTVNPGVPSLMNPLNGVIISDTLINFEWTEVTFLNKQHGESNIFSAPVRYLIQVDTTVNFISPVVQDTVDSTTIALGLAEGFYYWHVKAFDLAGNQGAFSSADSFKVDVTAPLIESTTIWTDTTLQGPFPVYTKISDVSGVDSAILYYKRIEDPVWVGLVLNDLGNDWYYVEIPQAYVANDTIKYYIKATDIAQPKNRATDPLNAPQNHYSFVANTVGIEERFQKPVKFSFSIGFKSETEVIFKIAIPQKAKILLRIYDIGGRIITTLMNREYSSGFYNIPFKPLSKGVYFYRLESPYLKKTGKIVVF